MRSAGKNSPIFTPTMSASTFFTSALVAALALSPVNAHMMLANPVPYGKSTLTTSPINADGSNWPCQYRGEATWADPVVNKIASGSDVPISFSGSASHGGGSCMFGVSSDLKPGPDSRWQVIHSIEGGCPIKGANGNGGSDNYTIKMPSDIAPGQYAFTWVWLNRIGNRELYSNCALIEVTGGTSKRDVAARRNELVARQNSSSSYPDLYLANICGGKCTTPEEINVLYPNPGPNVDNFGVAPQSSATPTCSCALSDIKATAPAGSGSGSGGSSGSGSGSSSGSGSAMASVTSSASGQPAISSAAAASGSSNNGGGILSTAIATATVVSTAQPAASTDASDASSTPTSSGTIGSSSVSPSSASSGGSSSNGTTSSSTTPSGGTINCDGSAAVACSADGTQFALCNGGTGLLQAVAPGTKCQNGSIVAA